MTTSFAFFCSMRYVTWFRPNLSTTGALDVPSPPAALPSAVAFRRSLFCALLSGVYLACEACAWCV
jgi:hypothetical protein